MTWTISITKTAIKQLKKLEKPTQKRIYNFLNTKIENTSNPRKHGKALRGKKSELWRYRVQDYRIICHLEDSSVTVVVLSIGHRKEIYE